VALSFQLNGRQRSVEQLMPLSHPLDTGPAESRAHQRLRLDIERAAMALDSQAVLTLLRANLPMPGMGVDGSKHGLEVLSAGFGGGLRHLRRESFAAFCIRNDACEVLVDVLRSDLAAPTELLHAACSWVREAPVVKGRFRGETGPGVATSLEFQTRSVFESALARSSVDGVRVAFAFDSGNRALSCAEKLSLLGAAETLHARALGLTLGHLSTGAFWAVRSSLAILEVFREHKAPVIRAHTSNYVLDAFVTADCPAEYQDELRSLFRAYVEAGYVNPNLRLTGAAAHKNMANLLPLSAAILLRNRAVAAELVLAGADSTAVGDDVNMPGLGAVDLVRACKLKPGKPGGKPEPWPLEETEAFAAELATAVMERTISSTSGPVSAGSMATARTRRVSRAL
jgi:hypothetical protein